MSLSSWVVVARFLILFEGVSGIILNSWLIFALLRTKFVSAARLYRISCLISAFSNILISILIAIIIDIPLMIDGNFIASLYGPLILLIPDKTADFIFVTLSVQTHMLWQLVPAPLILQYLSLNKSKRRNSTKVIYAYIVPFVLQINSWVHSWKYLPSDRYRKELQGIIARLHGASPNDCRVYGIPILSHTGKYDLVSQFYFDVFPSYFSSYFLFIFSAVKIRAKFRSFGTSKSNKTEQMQRRFFLTQIAQVFLPLIIASIPSGFIGVALFLDYELQNLSFLFVYAFWFLPSAQALLLLGFVAQSKTKRPQIAQRVSFKMN